MENQMIKRIMIKTLLQEKKNSTLQEKKNSFHSDYKQRQI